MLDLRLLSSPFFLAVLCSLPVFLLIFYLWHSSTYQLFKRNGIRGPSPVFFFGNFRDRMKVGFLAYLKQVHEEYGSIFGIYLGRRPQVLVFDLELIKLVTVKDFEYFIDRTRVPDVVNFPKGLLHATGESWRTTRQILSPTFSSYKMKAVIAPIVQRSVKSLVEVFQDHVSEDKSFECFKIFGAFTMESILAAAFGREIEIQKGQSDQLNEAAAIIFGTSREHEFTSVAFMTMLLSNVPWLEPVIKFLTRNSSRQRAFALIAAASNAVIRQRRMEGSQEKHKDLLQLMIDAEGEGSGIKKRLTDEDITGNAITFILAGYETTGNALSYVSYLLALHPQVQERLQQEIDNYFQENPDATPYQATQDLEYLDMVIQESLRLYPPAPVYARQCDRDYKFKDVTIPGGSDVLIPSILLHMDPQYWKDPEVFDPLRFSAEEKAKRPQLCYMPFGHGPRSCIGMRFALLEAKMALIEVLKRFSFVRIPDTEVPLKLTFGITISSQNGIYLKVATRDKKL